MKLATLREAGRTLVNTVMRKLKTRANPATRPKPAYCLAEGIHRLLAERGFEFEPGMSGEAPPAIFERKKWQAWRHANGSSVTIRGPLLDDLIFEHKVGPGSKHTERLAGMDALRKIAAAHHPQTHGIMEPRRPKDPKVITAVSPHAAWAALLQAADKPGRSSTAAPHADGEFVKLDILELMSPRERENRRIRTGSLLYDRYTRMNAVFGPGGPKLFLWDGAAQGNITPEAESGKGTLLVFEHDGSKWNPVRGIHDGHGIQPEHLNGAAAELDSILPPLPPKFVVARSLGQETISLARDTNDINGISAA